MSRELAKSTVEKFRKKLLEEQERLSEVIREIQEEQEEVRLTETSSDRSPDPNTAEGGSLAFEMEMELSLSKNAEDLLAKVNDALERIDEGGYGNCAECGTAIPVARLEVLPYTRYCVECASRR